MYLSICFYHTVPSTSSNDHWGPQESPSPPMYARPISMALLKCQPWFSSEPQGVQGQLAEEGSMAVSTFERDLARGVDDSRSL